MRKLEEIVLNTLKSIDQNYSRKTYLLAISGGSDSVCLFHVLKSLGINFQIAHCNFNLRGEESDGDEEFVRSLSKDYTLSGYFTSFQTTSFAKENKLSIQEAARKLRYNWFDELRIQNNIDYIITAHHQDDLIETILINLTRGTGLSGLKGIPIQTGKVIRPMLHATKGDVNSYISDLNINYRQDSSNDSLKYSRNYLRHKIIPALENVHQNAKKGVLSTMQNISSADEYLKEKLKEDTARYVQLGGVIRVKEVNNLSSYFIYTVLTQYGFSKSQTDSIIKSSQKGAVFYSKDYSLIKDEGELLIKKIQEPIIRSYTFDKVGGYKAPIDIGFEKLPIDKSQIVFKEGIAWIDADKVKFPFVLRKWKEGDVFQPLGMKGKKKLSDFFTDLKLNSFEKDDIWVLESEGKICWVVGKRLDESIKITSTTTKVIKVVTKL